MSRRLSFSYIYIIAFAMILVSCSSSVRDTVSDETPLQEPPVPSPPSSLAPGTANVTAIVQDCNEQKKHYVCSLRIKTVHGYGSATPPLLAGTVVKVRITKRLIEKSSYISSQILREEANLKVTLRYEECHSH